MYSYFKVIDLSYDNFESFVFIFIFVQLDSNSKDNLPVHTEDVFKSNIIQFNYKQVIHNIYVFILSYLCTYVVFNFVYYIYIYSRY